LREGAEVILRIRGEDRRYQAKTIEADPDRLRKELEAYLELFPQDAAYHEIRLNSDKSLVVEDLDLACKNSIMVEARPISYVSS
jgi:hypothetical protein